MFFCNASIGLKGALSFTQAAIIFFAGFIVLPTASAAPNVVSSNPSIGVVGSQVTISGSGFGITQGASTVQFNSVNAASVQSWSDTQIVATVPTTATSGPIRVTVGGVASNTNVYFTVPAPRITVLNPTLGVVGTQVTITGSGFQATKGTSYIQFNGTTATTTSWSDTQIIATVPSGATTGPVKVFVNTVSSNANFTFQLPSPVVTGVSPGAGPVSSQVTITGSGFGATQGASSVQFNNTNAISIQSWSNTQIIATMPMVSSPAPVKVTVGGVASNTNVNFTISAPFISGFSPSSGNVGTQVTITGAGFRASQGSSSIQFNNTVGAVTSWNDTQIVATVPTGASTGPIRAYVGSQYSNQNLYFTMPNPVVLGLAPGAGPRGTQVTINGHGFGASQGTSTVQFAGSLATVASWSDSQIVANVPPAASTGLVTVTVGGVASSSNPTFTIPAPRVDSVSPITGIVGTQITVNGAGFQSTQGSSAVTVNGYTATVQSWSDTQVIATVPAGASTGPVLVVVSTVNSNAHVYFTMPNPVITGLSPDTSSVGNQVTVNGVGFGATQGSSTVQFNGTTASAVASWSDNQIVATIPSGATSGNVRVNVGGVASNNNFSETISNILVSGVAPPAGPVGTQVTITGSSFGATQGTSTVVFNNTTATSIQSWSNTEIVVTVPSGATTGGVRVVVGSANSNTNKTFTVANVVVSSVSPAAGTVGTQVTINGSGFGATRGSSTVQFNGTTATSIQSWSNTQIVATLPEASTGPVRVTVGGIASNGTVTFTVPLPRLDSVSPTFGDIGAQVTLSGSNFGATRGSSSVYFSGTWSSATVLSWSDTQIVVTVSGGGVVAGATGTGPISVNTSAGSNKEKILFTVPNPIVNGVSPASGVANDQITITGTGFRASQGSGIVQFGNVNATVQSWSDTAIVALVPSTATSGALKVTVGGRWSNTDLNFKILAPRVESLSPNTGVVGTQFTIYGTNFGPPMGTSTIQWNGPYLTAPIISWSDSQIVATVPNTAATGAVQVVTNGGWSNKVVFTLPNPVVNAVSPSISAVGSQVTISGTGFGTVQGTNSVQINSVNASVQSWADTQIIATVPNTATGTVRVTVGGVSSNTNVYLTIPGPIVTGLSPTSGSVGTSLTITGANFGATQGNSSVQFTRAASGSVAGSVLSWSDTQIVATVPLTAITGPVSVVVNSIWSPADVIFTLPNPLITNVSPGQGPVSTSVTITGTGFGTSQSGSTVTFYGPSGIGQVGTATSWSDTQVVATVPTTAITGPVRVNVGGVPSNGEFYFMVPPPRIDAISPTSAGIGNQVTITGAYFQPTQTGGSGYVRFNSSNSVQVVSWNDNQIVATVPNSTATGPVTVVVNGVTSNNDRIFTIPGLVVNSVSPTSGPVGTQVTINGSAFGSSQGTSTVTFNGSAATTIQSWSNTQILATVPVTATTGPVKVTVNNIASNVTVSYTVPPPVITSISPAGGVTGDQVTINGSGFQANQRDSSISFNDVPASVVSWTDTQIVATVAASTTTGPARVTVNGVPSNNDRIFTVVNPVIATLSPAWGAPGGTVVISGSGFGATQGSGQVRFNSTSAAVTSWSDSTITATIPSSVTNGPVTIFTYGATSNPVTFTVQGSPVVSGISPGEEFAGRSVTVTGGNFGPTQSNSALLFNGTAAEVTSWSDSQIIANVPAETENGPVSGTVAVRVAGLTSVNGPQFLLLTATTVTDSLGTVSVYYGSTIGGKTRMIRSDGPGCSSCSVRGASQLAYDNKGNVLSSNDALGRATAYTYDASGNVLTETRYLAPTTPVTTSYTYNALGQVLTATDPLGQVTSNTYDSNGNLLSVTTPAPNGSTPASMTTFTYDNKGQLLTITDPLNHVTAMTYTAAGLVATITDANQKVTTFEYDTRGNRTAVIDALQNRTEFAYDVGNRLSSITYPDNKSVTFGYDYRGRRTSVTDQNLKTTMYAYDDADRLVSVTDAAMNVTAYAYDTESQLLSISDAMNRVTSFEYDAKGRLKKTTFPSGLLETYTYDAADNLVTKTDRKNQTITYLYDALDRLTRKQYPDTTGVDYIYDLVGRIQQVNDPTGSYGLAYDNMGRLIGMSTQYSFLPGQTFTNSYTYDAASNRTSFQAPDSSTTSYVYDTLNRLTSETSSWAGQFTFAYDDLSRRTTLNRPNGVNTSYSYDNTSRLLSVLHKLGAATVDGATYTVDDAGNRTSKQNHISGVTDSYAYDDIYQLTGAVQAGVTVESYLYDQVGNRTASHLSSTYNTNTSNQLLASADAAFTYDNNGNTLTKTAGSEVTSYTWDFENRLAQVSLPDGSTVSFEYDPFGRRIQKMSASGTINYLYGGAGITEERDASGNILARYVQGLGIDEPLAMQRAGAISYYHADGLGSVTALTDAAGALAGTYVYDSFGNLTDSSGSLDNPFRYTGREWDPEIGMYYYRARYYDPEGGRFLSEDPIGFAGGTNFYPYVTNNPVLSADPLGLQAELKEAPRAVNQGIHLVKDVAPVAAPVIARCVSNPVCGLVLLDAALLAYDGYQIYKLGVAYDWWGNNKGIPPYRTQQELNREGVKKAQEACRRASDGGGGDDECEEMYKEDFALCSKLGSSGCFKQATERYSACLTGRPIPPFPWRQLFRVK
jgi:RHS repeat-associated protein